MMPEGVKPNKKHIVIEGPIGVGKSSLSKKMAEAFGAHLLLEKPAENPFLERFYQSSEHYALPTQLFFLFQRVQQMAELRGNQMTRPTALVADFMIEKDPIFAELTLSLDEFQLYQQVFESLHVDATRPDLVVYLQAPVAVLKHRIKRRNIASEQNIHADYLERLSQAYTEYFHRYVESPLLIVNAAEFNPIENDAHFAALMRQIDKIHAGKHFFNPMS